MEHQLNHPHRRNNSHSYDMDEVKDVGNIKRAAYSMEANSGNDSDDGVDSDSEDAWKDAADTWLERWWIRSASSPRGSRMHSPRNRNSIGSNTRINCDGVNGGSNGEVMLKKSPSSFSIADRMRTCRRYRDERSDFISLSTSNSFRREGCKYCTAAIGNISLAGFVREESVARDTYRVSLFCSEGGMGLRLVMSDAGDVLVQGFNTLPNGMNGPAEDCGLIEVGDFLISVNDTDLQRLSANATVNLLTGLDRHSEVSRNQ